MAASLNPSWRGYFTWSNSRQSWQERLSFVVAVAGAWLLWYFAERFSAAVLTALWASLLLASAVLLRRGWLKLFGPVLFYELVRVARRRRYFLLRGLYAVVLACVFLWLYFLWIVERGVTKPLTPREMAALSEAFFSSFMLVQFGVVALLVPALAGGAIADEKERKTLEFLLATDLRNREIVLSKLAARLANITLIVLAGLPILSLMQFFGGIPPDLLLAGFAGLGLSALSITCLGIFFSVLLKRARDAILLTYLTLAAYLGLGTLLLMLLEFSSLAKLPIWFGDSPYILSDLIWGINAGNVIALTIKAGLATMGNQSLSAVLPGLIGEYFLFHGLVAVVCGGLAVLRLRVTALKQDRPRQAVEKLPLWRRRRLRDRPMVWKELHVEGGVRVGWFGTVVLALLVLASFLPVIFILSEEIEHIWRRSGVYPNSGGLPSFMATFESRQWMLQEVNLWARITSCLVALLMLIGVTVRASGSLHNERARQTLDSLLTTPMESTTIVGAKWLGSILCVRWGWLWLGAIWLVTMLIGALNVLAIPLMILAWCVYAVGSAALGLWFSLVCRTSLRATVWTLATLFALTGGQWLVAWLFIYLPLEVFASSDVGDSLARWQVGLTAPAAMGVFGFRAADFDDSGEFVEFFIGSLLGLVAWAIGTYALWNVILTRFRKETCRIPLQPEAPRRESASLHAAAVPASAG